MRKACAALALILACGPSAGRGDEVPAKDPPQPPELVDRLLRTLKGEEVPFTLVTKIYLRPGTKKEFETVASRVSKASAAEKGCLAYEFHRDLEKPTNYTLIEKWTGLAPLKAHLRLDHTKQIQAAFAEMSTNPRTTEIFAPIDGR